MVTVVSRNVMIKMEGSSGISPSVDHKVQDSSTQKPIGDLNHRPVMACNDTNRFGPQNNTYNNSSGSMSKALPTDRLVTKVGFANLPNQIHRKAVRRGFVFNLMITGSSGLGKSTFINSLFCADIYNTDYPGPSRRSYSSGTCVDSRTFALSEANVSLILTIIDTPGFGSELDNSSSWKPLVKYIDSRFESYLRAELNVSRVTVGSGATYQPGLPNDQRVHLCLYFISPNGHGLHQLDIETLKQLHNRVNVVVIIGKADSLTPDECSQFKQTILQELHNHNIKLYDFPESVAKLGGADESYSINEIRHARGRQPFAVVTSNNLVTLPDGRKVNGRSYPWGVVECDNLAHNDFKALKHLLMSVHLQDLIDVTHHVHYTNYFSSRLTSIAEASKFLATEDSREPLSQLETERLAHQRKLAKLESEMENVFEQKVHERTNKLIETERDLVERAEQSEKHILIQLTEFEKRRQEFEDERAIWEAENRESLEALQIIPDRGDFIKDKFRIKRKGLF
uniref:Septin-7.1 n=2 Tax=Schistosoma mansoni TaxID=6183 RepID=S5YE26_SCHMA|nr:septin-7.1 [Schistosoma mansoni]